jgi:hypothetical protein
MTRNACFAALAAVLLAGCSQSNQPAGSEYVLAAEPAGALGIVEARETVQNDDEVVLIGRVGGDTDPFVEGIAAFTLVDLSLEPCPAEEGCPTPWDYCCDLDKLSSHKATVKVVDQQGQLVSVDARKLLGVDELATVVVRGKAKRDEAGNLTVLANGVYLKP